LDKRPFLGLAGVIVTAMASDLNDQISEVALPDIQGGLGLSHDPATWFSSLYVSGACIGIAVSLWWSVTVSFRRMVFFVIALMSVTTVLVPFAPNLTTLYGLRVLQGMSGGFVTPMVMAVALRVLPPPIRLYGLVAYALTATFFPNLSAPAAALWTDLVSWRFAFFQVIPLGALAGVLCWHGMPVAPPQYARLRKIDWRGMALSAIALGGLTTLLQQGDRYDWWNSPFICILALVTVVAIPLLVLNEWFHELPLFKFQLYGRRNLAYGAIALFCFIIIGMSASVLPFTYLEEVQQFRPEQLFYLTTIIALLQLLFLPAAARLLDFAWVDARVLSLVGFSFILAACIGDSFLTSVWNVSQFVKWQVCQALGDALVVMPLLMMATNTIQPVEGPFGAALINTPRGLAEAVGIWLLQLIFRWRGSLHSDRLADNLGLERFRLVQATGVDPRDPPALLPNGVPRSPVSLSALAESVRTQTQVMTLSDAFLVMAAIAIFMMVVLLVLPQRTFSPRITLAQK
jgi:MFS transporter, DHA2 family, multidrug resistance protein